MTTVGVMRLKYALIEPRPSRFYDSVGYAVWCSRADEWAKSV
jgi:hypothetical protein